MSRVMVEFPIEEAEAMLEWPTSEPSEALREKGFERLRRAVNVERGPGGNAEARPDLAEVAEQMVGQRVKIHCKDGGLESGTVEIGTPNVLHLRVSSVRSLGIPLSRVASIEPLESAEAAA
jgi:hypothetical protein